MSTDLATKSAATGSITVNNMDDLARLGNMLAQSGYFADAKDAAQCGVKGLAGLEMGFGAFASMSGIHLISGRPAIGANLMAARVKASGRYDYRVRDLTPTACTIEFFQGSESIGVSTFTIEDARKAGTKNLDKFARNMLFARAMSNGVRWFTPDVFLGATVYTPEELGATVDEDGRVLDVQVRPHEDPFRRDEPAARPPLPQPAPEPVSVAPSAPRGHGPVLASDAQANSLARALKKHGLTTATGNAFLEWHLKRAFTLDDLTAEEVAAILLWDQSRWEEKLAQFAVHEQGGPPETLFAETAS
jgi:hypothetical protein